MCNSIGGLDMIRDDAKIITSSGVVIEAPISDEYLEKLNEEAHLYRSNDHVPESLSS